MNKKLFIVFAFLLLSLSGCGIVSLGYKYADVYLRYTVNSYATFSEQQKDFISKQVDLYMLWHRKNMLPVYVAFLQEMQRSVASGNVLKKEDVARYRKELRSLYVRTLQPLVNPATALLSSVEPRQIEELVQSLAKENKKQKDKELSGSLDDKRHNRAERTVDFLENIVGAFSDSQLEQIRAASIKLPFATSIYMQMREDNQAHLLGLLANNSKEEVVANFLSLWLLMPEKFRSPEEQRILQEFERASDEMIAEVYSILNEHQRDKLLKTIEKYIASFQDLSSQSQLSNTNSRLKNVSIFDI